VAAGCYPGVAGHTAKRYLSVHAGGQGTAVNAIEKMLKLLAAVQELERYWGVYKVHPLMPKGITTINIGACWRHRRRQRRYA